MEANILVVDDESEIVDLVSVYLRGEGFQVFPCTSGTEALAVVAREKLDMAVLDVMLPSLNGIEVLRRLRQERQTPVIILTARDQVVDKVTGLDIGADDYIEKPYDIDVLIAKIKGIFKRRYQHDILSADGVTLNLADKTAVIDGKSVELPSKEFDLLALLIENQGKVLKKSYLFGAVWGSDSDSELQTLHVHINRIRQKLGDDPKNAKRLLTIWGVGYKFV